MKTTTRWLQLLALTSALTCVAFTAQARERVRKNVVQSDTTSTGASSESAGSLDEDGRWGLGFATTNETFLAPSTAITGIMDLSGGNLLQGFFNIPETSPLSLTVGALFKHDVAHVGHSYFHLGGGIGLGTLPKTAADGTAGHAFALSFAGIMGLHFPVPGTTNVMIHLDGGPQFTLFDGNSNFHLSALSPGLGASVLYMF